MTNLLNMWPPIIAKYVHLEGPGFAEYIEITEPGTCLCGQVTDKFINRFGQTRCVPCDERLLWDMREVN